MNTPLYSKMLKCIKSDYGQFHPPAHKAGLFFDKFKHLKSELQENMFSMDLSVCLPELDSLQQPKTVIKEAQELAAKTFHADKTFFVTGGSTLANLISLFALFKEGNKIIVGRNIHKSIYSGIVLRGLNPIFVNLKYSENMPLNVNPEGVEKAIENHPDAKGVVLTSPSYDGVCADLEKISEICHWNKIPLFVDEAWGAHLGFNRNFPKSAIQSGADISVQSTHKLLGSLRQGSMIHIKSIIVNCDKFRESFNYFSTTSASYPILASLDIIRAIYSENGESFLQKTLENIVYLKREINKLKNFKTWEMNQIEQSGFSLDQTKITINCENISGFEVVESLRNKFKIQPGKFDESSILFLVTPADRLREINRLIDALKKIDKKYSHAENKQAKSNVIFANSFFPKLTPKIALNSESEMKEISNSVGDISAEAIIPYPPGIPLLLPGEIITKDIILQVNKIKKNNVEIQGTMDTNLNTIRVVK